MNTVDELPLFSEPGDWKGRVDGRTRPVELRDYPGGG